MILVVVLILKKAAYSYWFWFWFRKCSKEGNWFLFWFRIKPVMHVGFDFVVRNLHKGTYWLWFRVSELGFARLWFRISFTNNNGGLKKIPRTANCPKNLHVKNEVILWPLTSSKIIVLVAQPILTDGGPPAWAVDKRAELGWPSSRGKGWPAVCKSGPRLCSFTVCAYF